MKYKVLGRRVLIKVKKFKAEEVKKKKEFVEGSSMILAPELKDLEDATDMETVTQTKGEVIGLGEGAWLNDDGTSLHGQVIPVKIGDIVHFQRYGAVRLEPKKHDTEEYWVVEDKDLFCINNIKENEEAQANVK